MEVTIVAPTYNEAENIEKFLEEVHAVLEKEKAKFELLVIDDSSPDGTGEKASEIAKRLKKVRVIKRNERGFGSALRRGYSEAKGKYIIAMDADFSHDPQDIPRILEKLREGHDIVLGSRYVKGGRISNWTIFRRLESKVAGLLARTVLSLRTKDVTTGYRGYNTESLRKLELMSEGYNIQPEIVFKAENSGFNICEVPVIFKDRERGEAKLSGTSNFREVKEYIKLIFRMKASCSRNN